VAFIILLIPALIWQSRLGWDDVKLAGLIGLVTGFPGTLVALAMAGSGLAAIIFVVSRLKERGDAIPFGPFLGAGALATLLWSQPIIDWYLSLPV